MIISLIAIATFVGTFVYSSFFEWALHKYIMHSDHWMSYPFRAHQLEHHEVFKADDTYFFDESTELKHVTFAWWNAPLLFSINTPFFAAIYFWVGGWIPVLAALAAMVSYYALYEYLHFCMHVPAKRALEKTRVFQFVQTHHRLHHIYYMKNLNVVVPIADFILRTRVTLTDPGVFEKLERVRQKRLDRVEGTLPVGSIGVAAEG